MPGARRERPINGIDALPIPVQCAGDNDDDPRPRADPDGPVAYPRRATVLPALL
ncbi:hypothetical protein FEP63_05076 [Burkholderia multivorans]|nr:hypothetical protein [Burkholderia multivorans]MDR8879273.1 hypothetical protein [Burkholderia multivorans]MDR8889396.1 hypothetical protein [Burkholderia multivorans]MDR8891810.1 hypothetical protein [Burkholderia multivorans]MDR8898436.1 hypothetical protein [Burkholderia multivorans]